MCTEPKHGPGGCQAAGIACSIAGIVTRPSPAMNERWAMLAVIFLTRIAIGFQFQSIASVAPFLIERFRLSYAQVGLLMGLYVLPGGLIALPAGILGRRFGERRVAVLGLLLMVAGGVLLADSTGFVAASAWRVVSGVGGVLLNVMVAKLVADWFAGRELSTAMGVLLPAWPVGIALALASLGALASASSWQVSLHLSAQAAAAGFVLMALVYRDPPQAAAAPAADPPTGWLHLSRRDLGLAGIAGLAWSVFNASLVVFWGFAPGFLIDQGIPVGQAGFLVSVSLWVRLAAAPLSGYVTDRVRRPHAVIAVGSVATALVLLAVPLLPGPVVWFALAGIVGSLPGPALMALLPAVVRSDRLAPVLGLYYTLYYLGMAVAQPLAGWIRDLSGHPAAPIYFAAVLMAATGLPLPFFRRVEGAEAAGRKFPAAPAL